MEINTWLTLSCFICGCLAGLTVAFNSRNLTWVGALLLAVWCVVVLTAHQPEWLKTVLISPLTMIIGFVSFAALNQNRKALYTVLGLSAYCAASAAFAYHENSVLVFAISLLVPTSVGLISFSWYVGYMGLMSRWLQGHRTTVLWRIGCLLVTYLVLISIFSRSGLQVLIILASMGLPFAYCFSRKSKSFIRVRHQTRIGAGQSSLSKD